MKKFKFFGLLACFGLAGCETLWAIVTLPITLPMAMLESVVGESTGEYCVRVSQDWYHAGYLYGADGRETAKDGIDYYTRRCSEYRKVDQAAFERGYRNGYCANNTFYRLGYDGLPMNYRICSNAAGLEAEYQRGRQRVVFEREHQADFYQLKRLRERLRHLEEAGDINKTAPKIRPYVIEQCEQLRDKINELEQKLGLEVTDFPRSSW